MNKSNVIGILERFENPTFDRFQCPECQKIVNSWDFVTSYRLIENSNPPSYQVKNLCRKCRDSGL